MVGKNNFIGGWKYCKYENRKLKGMKRKRKRNRSRKIKYSINKIVIEN